MQGLGLSKSEHTFLMREIMKELNEIKREFNKRTKLFLAGKNNQKYYREHYSKAVHGIEEIKCNDRYKYHELQNTINLHYAILENEYRKTIPDDGIIEENEQTCHVEHVQ
jgi:hypothetical protein